MRKIFGYLIGLLVGGLVGGVLALLFTPESGVSIRGKLNQKSSGFIGEIRAAVDDRRKLLEDRLAELRNP